MVYRLGLMLCSILMFNAADAQQNVSSSQVLHEVQKLGVHGTVLYVAAHPDDENTRLLSYLVNEKKYRTGYLSLTRGDGGQNLIGDEQGIEMGLIRTQELIAARKVDGAEQYFTRAYDFGYSKSPAEALRIWGHEAVLSDVVWTIRTLRPDVIICRFPTTGEGGHGHHTASAILAGEAFDAAADPTRFPEQLKNGVQVWQAKRLLWNTYSFEGMNTTRDDQFKIDCGGFNALLGMSYGEMSAESRSKHSSQGFGVPAQRGSSFEYFATIKGSKPVKDLMDDVETGAARLGFKQTTHLNQYQRLLNDVILQFSPLEPHAIIPQLQQLENLLNAAENKPLAKYKLEKLQQSIVMASGIFMEAIAQHQQLVLGDSAKITFSIINRNGLKMKNAAVDFSLWPSDNIQIKFHDTTGNVLLSQQRMMALPVKAPITQPYWLNKMPNGLFAVQEQSWRNQPERVYPQAMFSFRLNDKLYVVYKPIQYKFTDPTKGEKYQPAYVTTPVHIRVEPSRVILSKQPTQKWITLNVQFNVDVHDQIRVSLHSGKNERKLIDTLIKKSKGELWQYRFAMPNDVDYTEALYVKLHCQKFGTLESPNGTQQMTMTKISYPHIPDIVYHLEDSIQVLKMDCKISGKRIGYIAGAGDKVPEALTDMGYEVVMLDKAYVLAGNYTGLDAIVTGVRAYNLHNWLDDAYSLLMKYVENGGVLLVQYNTNNRIAPLKSYIGPYPFSITRNRITDEQSTVQMINADHRVFNYPNKITSLDFVGWVQERSIYHAGTVSEKYTDLLSMNDPGEKTLPGALIMTEYGKGKFIYTGLSLFRQLPAGVVGAYRLLANLLAQ